MISIPDAVYVPDLDSPRVPGAVIDMSGFAPVQRGQFGSISLNQVFTWPTVDVTHVQTFRQVNDSVRMLVFRTTDIDEVTSTSGGYLNRGAGYTGTTWDAAAWGNQIIAVNGVDAAQSSTGGAFSALGGSSPIASCVAANVNFVMMANTSSYSDQVHWSALQNPSDWVASIATQSGNVRLLDAPGPIKRLVAYKDKFIAFKENAIFIGEYIGPPLLFQWRLVSSRIGLAAPKAVCELDDRLYFVHQSGVYEFDGSNVRNVGLPVWHTILNTFGFTGFASSAGIGGVPSPGSGYEGTAISNLKMVGDDIEGVVWLSCYTQRTLNSKYRMYLYGYNVRTSKWAKAGLITTGATRIPVLMNTTHADMRAFLGSAMPTQARAWYFDNVAGLYDMRYPDALVADLAGTITTAVQGSPDSSTRALRVYTRCLEGSDETPFTSGTLYGWSNEQRTAGSASATCLLNTDLESLDGTLEARFKQAYLVSETGKTVILAGLGIEYPPMSRR